MTQQPQVAELEHLERMVSAAVAFPVEASPRQMLIATLSVLVERLTAGEAHTLLVALPTAVQELLAERVLRREGQPVARLARAEFLLQIAAYLSVTPAWAEDIAR